MPGVIFFDCNYNFIRFEIVFASKNAHASLTKSTGMNGNTQVDSAEMVEIEPKCCPYTNTNHAVPNV